MIKASTTIKGKSRFLFQLGAVNQWLLQAPENLTIY